MTVFLQDGPYETLRLFQAKVTHTKTPRRPFDLRGFFYELASVGSVPINGA